MGESCWVSGLLGASDSSWAGCLNNTNIHQPPTFQCEAMRVSAKPPQGGCMGHQAKQKQYPGGNNDIYAKIINHPKRKIINTITTSATKLINHHTQCKRTTDMEAVGALY